MRWIFVPWDPDTWILVPHASFNLYSVSFHLTDNQIPTMYHLIYRTFSNAIGNKLYADYQIKSIKDTTKILMKQKKHSLRS